MWLALVSGTVAQELPLGDEGEAEQASRPLPVGVGEIADHAAETRRILGTLAERADRLASVDLISSRLDDVAAAWRKEARETLWSLSRDTSATLVGEVERIWSAREKRLERWNAGLRRRAVALADALEELGRERELWEQTRDEEREEELASVLRKTIREVLADLESTRNTVRERLDALLAVQHSVLGVQRHVTEVLEAVDDARERARSQLFVRESPPLWAALPRAQPRDSMSKIRASWKASVGAFESYLEEEEHDLGAYVLLLVSLVGGIALLGRSVAQRTEEDPEAAVSTRLLRRPLSAALLVLLVAYPLILTTAPLLLRWIAAIVVLLPALRLIGPLLEGPARRALYWLSGLYAVDVLRLLLEAAPLLVRLMILLEAAAAGAFLVWSLRPSRLAALRAEHARVSMLGAAARAALVLLAASLLANLVGNVSLAELLLAGTLRGAFLAVLLRGSALVLDDLWAVLLHTRGLRMLGGVRRHQVLLRRRGSTLVKWVLVFVWLWLTLGFFQLRRPVWDVVVAVSGATWPVGGVELSLGDLVAFGFTVWLAIWLSRFVRFVLDEDVLPRADLPRGVPNAISAGAHYLILLFGFVLAVAAAGFDMSRFTLIVGALGVGIGIGLQDVVNNFVSGLILLFERPVKPGDTVQVGDVFGEVRRIGLRSSTVRTWSGAEVIVPNSKLVSENLVNWTLSDTARRIEIPIGVAYGTDPERVIALLLEAAGSHPAVLAKPAPSAIFQAHGSSSLDFELRAWTGSVDWVTVRSELTVTINRALREAGIQIPFPQRDLHLRSLDPAVSDTLRRPPNG